MEKDEVTKQKSMSFYKWPLLSIKSIFSQKVIYKKGLWFQKFKHHAVLSAFFFSVHLEKSSIVKLLTKSVSQQWALFSCDLLMLPYSQPPQHTGNQVTQC